MVASASRTSRSGISDKRARVGDKVPLVKDGASETGRTRAYWTGVWDVGGARSTRSDVAAEAAPRERKLTTRIENSAAQRVGAGPVPGVSRLPSAVANERT